MTVQHLIDLLQKYPYKNAILVDNRGHFIGGSFGRVYSTEERKFIEENVDKDYGDKTIHQVYEIWSLGDLPDQNIYTDLYYNNKEYKEWLDKFCSLDFKVAIKKD